MTDDVARTILLIGFAVVAPIGVYHRLKARTDERFDRTQEGWLILLTLRPLGVVCLGGTVAFAINPEWMGWSAIAIPGWLRFVGVAFGVPTAMLVVWTFRSLGHNLTDTVATRRDAVLVTHGPYRWVRHPFYLAFGLGVLANSLVTANWLVAVTGVMSFLMIVRRTSIEESKLIDRFGDEYTRFMGETGRFLPKLR